MLLLFTGWWCFGRQDRFTCCRYSIVSEGRRAVVALGNVFFSYVNRLFLHFTQRHGLIW